MGSNSEGNIRIVSFATNRHCFGETEAKHDVIAVYSRAQNRGLNLILPEYEISLGPTGHVPFASVRFLQMFCVHNYLVNLHAVTSSYNLYFE